jgi:hypothetical protein
MRRFAVVALICLSAWGSSTPRPGLAASSPTKDASGIGKADPALGRTRETWRQAESVEAPWRHDAEQDRIPRSQTLSTISARITASWTQRPHHRNFALVFISLAAPDEPGILHLRI